VRNIIEKTKSFEEKKYIFISYEQKASRNQLSNHLKTVKSI